MQIERAILGTWFQRTSLHLREIHAFLEHKKPIGGLNEKRLDTLWKALNVKEVVLREDTDFHFLEAKCGEFGVSITEDGIILLEINARILNGALRRLEEFYAAHFGPALEYLFSRGAPLPKGLTDAKEVYPMYLLVRDTAEGARQFFQGSQDSLIGTLDSPHFEVLLGSKASIFIAVNEDETLPFTFDELVRLLVFFQEFEQQLNNYLHLHRDLWDRISSIRELSRLRYRDFPMVRQKILAFLETLSYVKARLAQMMDIMVARVQSTPPALKSELHELGMQRFAHLTADQRYINHLWEMTTEYASSTLTLLSSFFQENTQRELTALKFITLIGAITSFFGMNIAFPWEERWSQIFESSLLVLLVIALASFIFYYLLKLLVYQRYFTIHEKK
ncbi:MAG: hypothetical protein HY459_04395 [Parcubacteria group bacterium]|nr:hypothetical protein [Parcubacteria group bacterium]